MNQEFSIWRIQALQRAARMDMANAHTDETEDATDLGSGDLGFLA